VARAVHEHRQAARPIVADYGGRIVKTTVDGLLLKFSSVVPSVECAIATQKLITERNAGVAEASRILYRIGIKLSAVVMHGEDILRDGVNISAWLEDVRVGISVIVSRRSSALRSARRG
jgi:adenylate cyclase